MDFIKDVLNFQWFGGTTAISCILLTCMSVLIMPYLLEMRRKASLLNKIPGPKGYPIVGNTVDVNNLSSPEIFKYMITQLCSPHPAIGRMKLGFTNYVAVYKASSVETVLSSSRHITKGIDYQYLYPWLGTGLLTANGEKWHQRRKLLTPTFHFKILEEFAPIFNQQGQILVNKLMDKADSDDTFDVFPFYTLCTLDIILETAIGITINAQDNDESEYVKAVYKMSNLMQGMYTRPSNKIPIIFKLNGNEKIQNDCLKVLHGLSMKVIKERKEELLKKKKEPQEGTGKKKLLAFLDLLLEAAQNAGNNLSDDDIREEVDTFIFEGHDTTAAATTWSTYLLATHPDIQAKVHEELDEIFGEDRDRDATTDDLRQMKYLDCCIKEALRVLPSVPFISRLLNEEIDIAGYTVPKGTTIGIIIHKLHRDPEVFPDPESFKPERFFPENCVDRHPYAYVPFSAGPRNCIGQKFAQMEEKILISKIFRNFRVESTMSREELGLTSELILRADNGVYVKMFKR